MCLPQRRVGEVYLKGVARLPKELPHEGHYLDLAHRLFKGKLEGAAGLKMQGDAGGGVVGGPPVLRSIAPAADTLLGILGWGDGIIVAVANLQLVGVFLLIFYPVGAAGMATAFSSSFW